ncbi:DUF3135 domain-containing protein [Ketobacter sp. MCCC 1A13808]|uniref:DUF3135 domain-containing protein n=1 Tax=Ketobacter sp. MCCC 1A13808 TaxID=2602738 RepID=UPI000F2982E1|nr:DUF3135 domain-containing protein [Ketobacter sp. MCCC 1A13808]MVF14180.1 DUF3135 domain-containing protein [Ketobacter sp. MCCC 1A13808]RLP54087.1 MAG: DUF3135 domain-containing protein [Ketobacter sp.]
MNHALPDFDQLKEMAENNPEQLEQLRIQLCEQVIQDAPEKYRRKLRGLQFRLDMERRKAKSPMAACIAISGMMHDSFDRLRLALNDATGKGRPFDLQGTSSALSSPAEHAKVLPFRRA